MKNKILDSIEKFQLNLDGLTVLTEAASGNYIVTPIIAALAGAEVFAITKSSKYASAQEVKEQTISLAKELNVDDKITILTNRDNLEYSRFDIVTNTGFVRPINKDMVGSLSSNCVIPLMWEPWEYRVEDLDLEECSKKGIKVYGTDESDNRLKTMTYIGYTVLSFLLDEKKTPFSTKILLLGNKIFAEPIMEVLQKNDYIFDYINEYTTDINIQKYNVVLIAENVDNVLLVGENGYIKPSTLTADMSIIHICGNVDFSNINCRYIPKEPADFGYMSFTTDYIDNKAVIDLHTAGLKVAEGMNKANREDFSKQEYKNFMEINYPALSFNDKKYW